jgi:GT2 family glycosyltransferase
VSVKAWAPRAGGLSDCLDGDVPVAVRTIDLADDIEVLRLPRSRTGTPYHRLLALVRDRQEPLGWVSVPVQSDGAVPGDVLAQAAKSLSGLRSLETRSSSGSELSLSVVVTTCANSELVVHCVEGLLASAAGLHEIVVVENRPERSVVERALEERFGSDERIRYVEEQRRGLSRARNAGLSAARGELIAFTDDDILVDPLWVPSLCGAFASMPQIDAVMGLILPLELETPAQLLVERFMSFGKGFSPRVYSLDAPPLDQPLFPYTAGYFGSGANMAFRTPALREIGGFDTALGAGTIARGGEDLDICIRLLHSGRSLAYEPRAMVWHRHPDTAQRLSRQVFAYGIGLGAMLSKQILVGPHRLAILARVPRGIRYFKDPTSRKNALRGSSFPWHLSQLERLGLLWGPLAYLASRLGGWR